MDSVELARQRAAELHSDAVLRGLNPWNAYSFAVKEAERQGYDVNRMAAGAAMLDGGRAKLLPGSFLILHENKGSPFEQALLIAHELGHAELGDAEDATPAMETDFARSAEPSPIGEDRVVDYSRKQRREVQMDLFAREFLLPRPHLRKLHLDDGLTAKEIARRLEAPYDVVAQQLLDALLLPPVVLDTATEAERPLNARQQVAVQHRGVPYLLEAGPGTGKTQTLVARVEALLDEGVDPRQLLVLTFSNKAAGEMADRIARKQPRAAAAIWVGTFHSFGLDIIRRFHTAFDMSAEPRMLDRTTAVELLEDEFARLDLKHYRDLYDPTRNIVDILNAISRAKDEVVGPAQYQELATAMRSKASTDDEVVTAERALEVACVYAAYEDLKAMRNVVDFGDLVRLPVVLLEQDTRIRKHLQDKYSHILVDEYQDVNRSSVRLLQALSTSGQNLWVVGDAKQAIYRFRGASPFNMARFGVEDFPGGIRGQLDINYRSRRPIVSAYSSFSKEMRVGSANSQLTAFRTDAGAFPELQIAVGADEQTVAMADTIVALNNKGIPYRDQAVLCTGNDRLATLAQQLEGLDIPVLFLGNLFERPEVKDLLSLLSLLRDARAMGLVRVACMPTFRMEMQDVAMVLTHLRQNEGEPLTFLSNRSIAGLGAAGADALARLAPVLGGFAVSASPWDVLAEILLDRTTLAADMAKAASIKTRAQSIAVWQLMNFVKSQAAGPELPVTRLLQRIRSYQRLGDDTDLRQLPMAARSIDAVRLMTIHGAKGLEFGVVHIPGLNEDTIPGRPRGAPACPPPEGMIQGTPGTVAAFLEAARLDEQECLFYVALSRAKDQLFLYAYTKDRANRNRRLSEGYLSRLGAGFTRVTVSPARGLPSAAEDVPIAIKLSGGLRLSDRQIEDFERCPRRFFYTHVLQTGGRRVATSFVKMHDAVRVTYKKVIAGEITASGEALVADVEAALRAEGLGEHGYFDQFREFAFEMIRYFNDSRIGHVAERPTALRVAFGAEEIVVTPDDILLVKGTVVAVRQIRTGHQKKSDNDSIGAAVFLAAAGQAFPHANAELIYLADQRTQVVSLTDAKLENRKASIGTHLRDIREGRFPAKRSSFVCPNCPALFICGPVPPGELKPDIRAAS